MEMIGQRADECLGANEARECLYIMYTVFPWLECAHSIFSRQPELCGAGEICMLI